jgi:ribosome-binding ATPase
MKIGLVGLPLSGKTTLFNALTGSEIDTTAYMGGKSDAHHAIVHVPDERVDKLADIFEPKKKTPATIEYIDLAGLSSSEQKKAGFSDQFLGQIRTVEAILVTLRAFTDENIPHPLTSVDPVRDLSVIESEFILSDLSIIENRMDRLERQMRAKKQDQDVREFAVLERFKESLENEQPLRLLEINKNDELLIRGYQFLTLKPIIILLNIDENDITNSSILGPLQDRANEDYTKTLAVSAKIEMEIQQLSEDEAELFRSELGITESAMGRLVRTSYDLLGLLSFLTVGSDEVRAWTINKNTHAPIAGGAIHSDIERGFIRAEVVAFEEFIPRGTLAQCRSDGVLRLEGKDYIVKDGDIINFRFAV